MSPSMEKFTDQQRSHETEARGTAPTGSLHVEKEAKPPLGPRKGLMIPNARQKHTPTPRALR